VRLNYVRELDEYPQGLRRLRLLATAVLAILIGSYEAQIAPVVPLLLKDLHISLTTYARCRGGLRHPGHWPPRWAPAHRPPRAVRLLVPLMMLTRSAAWR